MAYAGAVLRLLSFVFFLLVLTAAGIRSNSPNIACHLKSWTLKSCFTTICNELVFSRRYKFPCSFTLPTGSHPSEVTSLTKSWTLAPPNLKRPTHFSSSTSPVCSLCLRCAFSLSRVLYKLRCFVAFLSATAPLTFATSSFFPSAVSRSVSYSLIT